jgi:PAS domain S-box-containing protein
MPLAAGLVVLTVSIAGGFQWYRSQRLEQTVAARLTTVAKTLEMGLDNDARSLAALIELLQADRGLQEAFTARDRERLLQAVRPTFEGLRAKYRITHFYFHDPLRVCFLRVHEPGRHGDVINRFTMVAAEKTGRTAQGIELGPLGLFTLRVVHPWRVNGRLIGYLELGEEIDHVVPRIRATQGVELVAKIGKAYLDRAQWESGMKLMGRKPEWDQFRDCVLLATTLQPLPEEVAALVSVPRPMHAGKAFQCSFSGKQYWAGWLPVVDAGHRDLGDMIVLLDVSADVLASQQAFLGVGGMVLLFAGGLAWLFWIYLGRLQTSLAVAARALREREKASERAAAQLRTLSRAVEHCPASVVITDLGGTVEYVNPEFVKTTGYACEEVLGANPRTLRSGLHPQEFYRKMWETILRGEVWRGEICNRKKNGELFWEDATIAPVLSADGCATHFVAVKMDITSRKQSEMELRATTAFQQAILNSAAHAIIASRDDGTITAFNAGAERMFGYDAGEVLGRLTPEAFHDPEEVRRRAESLTVELGCAVAPGFEAFVAKARLGLPDENEWTYRRKDGTRLPVVLSVTAIRDDSGQITGFMGIAQDITARKKAAQELEQYARRLEQANGELARATVAAQEASKAKSEFLANMSHELRTPLNGVIGMTELLRNTPLDDRQRGFIEACHSSGRALLDLINDILDFSKIEAGKLETERHAFDLQLTVRQTVETMAFQASEKGLELTLHTAPETPDQVVGDSTRLRQVLVNLIGNAIKFTDSGTVTVSVEPSREPHDAVGIRFRVSDTGVGIPADRIGRLFQSFCQADSSTTRRYGGTGLGLAICKRLVELMGGRIGVESRPGKGSTFWFMVPLPVVAGAASRADSAAPTQPLQKPTVNLLQGRRVLLAEDNHVNQVFVRELCREFGIECRIAANGAEAVQAVESERFDLVLMDCQMPTMDGFEATRRIRSLEDRGKLAGHLPVVALTANAIQGDRDRCLAAGMDGYLTKPFEPDQLLRTLTSMLASRVEASVEQAADRPATAAPSAGGPPPLDAEALRVRCMGNLEFVATLLADFERDLLPAVEQIARYALAGDPRATAEAAHALKGEAGTITADPLRAAAAAVEAAGKTGDLSQVTALVERLRDEAQRCLGYLPDLRREIAASDV